MDGSSPRRQPSRPPDTDWPRGAPTVMAIWCHGHSVSWPFCVMAGKGRPPTAFLRRTRQMRGWSASAASAGHDTERDTESEYHVAETVHFDAARSLVAFP